MDARPLLKFFKPMQEWLTRRNQELGVTPGWNKGFIFTLSKDEWFQYIRSLQNLFEIFFYHVFLLTTDPDCSADKDFSKWMSEYNTQASIIMTNDVTASWNYQVHITDENEKAMVSIKSDEMLHFKARVPGESISRQNRDISRAIL